MIPESAGVPKLTRELEPCDEGVGRWNSIDKVTPSNQVKEEGGWQKKQVQAVDTIRDGLMDVKRRVWYPENATASIRNIPISDSWKSMLGAQECLFKTWGSTTRAILYPR